MNKTNRARIDAIIKDIENSASVREDIDNLLAQINEKISDYKGTFADARNMIEELKDEEQEKFDNLSEGLQNSERGQNIESAVQALETAIETCDQADEIEEFTLDFDVNEIITALDEAKGY